MSAGPLAGIRVIELAGIGPGPFAAMLLSDMGADVVRVDRMGQVDRRKIGNPPDARGTDAGPPASRDVLTRGRRSIGVDLKKPQGVEVVLRLVEAADVLLEGFRPGVTERLGVGPDRCAERNPRLIYGRMTGWGQEGPWAGMAGHDIDYLALAGALHPIGPAGRPPTVPLNYVADFGGGGAFLAFGVACALVERATSNQGQVIDAAMVDGVAAITAMVHGLLARGMWTEQREANLLDGGAPFYRCYRTADGAFMAVGALEPQFYAELLARLGLDPADWPQHDRSRWPELRRTFTDRFASRSRDEWSARFEGSDACVAPVLSPTEARTHPHMTVRGTFVEYEGLPQPAPAPRLSRTPGSLSRPPVLPGQHTAEVLAEAGFAEEEMAALREAGAVC
ncbi:MAG: CoA transferase [Nitriliruptorales bacterium]|nr:CoA transferase [Nitriliruptorales bacterium]